MSHLQINSCKPGKSYDNTISSDFHNKENITNGMTFGIPECAVCLQLCIHPARLPCNHVFCYLCVKGVANQSKRCPMCRQEIPSDFLECPQLIDLDQTKEKGTTITAIDDSEHEDYQWFYEGRNEQEYQYAAKRTATTAVFQESDAVEEVNPNIAEVNVDAPRDAHCSQQIDSSIRENDFDLTLCSAVKNYSNIYQCSLKRTVPSSEEDWVMVSENVSQSGWWQYDQRTNLELEAAYKEGKRSCELLIAGFLYTADFGSMLQLRHNDHSRRRRIKRDLSNAPKKGVAGLRLGNASNHEQEEQQDPHIIREFRGTERPANCFSDNAGNVLVAATNILETSSEETDSENYTLSNYEGVLDQQQDLMDDRSYSEYSYPVRIRHRFRHCIYPPRKRRHFFLLQDF